ncbi:hypothetical protein ACF1B0_04420 [Streptomyces anandii]|uniref:hypothetical protein n=1 Tax=Streptomyces anandii TaxID=285454 RepID=UPI0036FF6E0C
MVFRSTWQDLRQWVRSYVLGGEEPPDSGSFGLSDEELKAQAIQDEGQTRNLIAIEKARGAMETKRMAVLLAFGLAAIAVIGVVICVVLLVVGQMVKGLQLPWSPLGSVIASILGASATGGAAWWGRSVWKRKKEAAATEANPSENRAEGDPDQVGTA